MAMHLCRNVRCYANKLSHPVKTLCSERFSIGARSYTSCIPEPEITRRECLITGAFLSLLVYGYDWGGLRTRREASIVNVRRLQFEHAKAKLDRIEREIDAIKMKQHKRVNEDNIPKEVSCANPSRVNEDNIPKEVSCANPTG